MDLNTHITLLIFVYGHLIGKKWENCLKIHRLAWAHRHVTHSTDVLSVNEIVNVLARTVSCGGNLLLNIGPNEHGQIPTIFEDRLRTIGSWLDVNGDAIYGTKPWIYQNDSNIWLCSIVVQSDHSCLGIQARCDRIIIHRTPTYSISKTS